VHEAAAIGVPDRIWGEEIVCYVVPAEGARPSEAEILAHAARLLPEFKRPRRILAVAALPRNERGKVRRDELRALWSNSGMTVASERELGDPG
jgi:acyl-coenzyme A synthetase/AMP-(fatty) acid ligase